MLGRLAELWANTARPSSPCMPLTPVLTETLASLFKPYRPILPITAHRNVRMRGQAFVSFASVDNANDARKEVNEFPLYGKAMVRVRHWHDLTC